MRHSVFSTSIKILIVTLILLAVCFNREVSQYLMIGAAILWLVILIGCLLSKNCAGWSGLCPIPSAVRFRLFIDSGRNLLRKEPLMRRNPHSWNRFKKRPLQLQKGK